MFVRLGRWCCRRRWSVVGLWLLLALTAAVGLNAIGGARSHTVMSVPSAESSDASEILDEYFGGTGSRWLGNIVFVADDGVDDPTVRQEMSGMFAAVDDLPGTTVTSPYTRQGERQIAADGEYAGTLAYATVELPSQTTTEEAEEMRDAIAEVVPDVPGVRVELGGEIFYNESEPQTELIGISFAIVILILAFGSVIAMSLPIGVALAGIGVGLTMAGFASRVMEMSSFGQTIGMMLGLGVGIDYALFIVLRVRENRHAGQDVEQSVATAIGTAGRAVAFAGATVLISIMGLALIGLDFVTGVAVSAAIVVAVTLLASLTLLPALLGLIGDRLGVSLRRGMIAAGLVSIALLGVAFGFAPMTFALPLAAVVLAAGRVWAPLKREVPARRQRPIEETFAYRWSRLIQRRPWVFALTGAAVLAVIALPVTGMRFGFPDQGDDPADRTTRQAYDLIAGGLGRGYNGPLVLAARVSGDTSRVQLDQATAQVSEALDADAGVAKASPPVYDDPESPSAVMWQVIPTTSPQDSESTDLIHRLRNTTLPGATDGSGLEIAVAGSVAANADFSSYLADRMPLFFAGVLALSFLLLMIVFRSVLVALKAVVMNLLGIGAAYGILVAGFQWGWLGPVLGIDSGPIMPFLPMMMFAIVFGLSMDYEVFLLARIKEDWDRTGNSRESVANGLASSARVITAAALIMFVVFGAFTLGDERLIKMVGVGLSSAVLLDATIVRMLLVPATMELLGDYNWWFPRWLDRLLPTIDAEGRDFAEEGNHDPTRPAPAVIDVAPARREADLEVG